MSAFIVPRGHLQHRTHPLVPRGPRRAGQIHRQPAHRRKTFPAIGCDARRPLRYVAGRNLADLDATVAIFDEFLGNGNAFNMLRVIDASPGIAPIALRRQDMIGRTVTCSAVAPCTCIASAVILIQVQNFRKRRHRGDLVRPVLHEVQRSAPRHRQGTAGTHSVGREDAVAEPPRPSGDEERYRDSVNVDEVESWLGILCPRAGNWRGNGSTSRRERCAAPSTAKWRRGIEGRGGWRCWTEGLLSRNLAELPHLLASRSDLEEKCRDPS